MNKLRVFVAFAVSNFAFVGIYSAACGVITFFNVTPYGIFVSKFFKGRTADEAKAYIEANKELYTIMMPEAVRFSNAFITPLAGFIMGLIAGAILATADKDRSIKRGAVWSAITALPLTALYLAKSKGEPHGAIVYIVLFLAVATAGGALGYGAARRTAAAVNAQH